MPVNGKLHFRLVQDVEEDHVVAAVPQAIERLKDRLRLGQQVGKNHHQAGVPQHGRHLHQAVGDVGLALAA